MAQRKLRDRTDLGSATKMRKVRPVPWLSSSAGVLPDCAIHECTLDENHSPFHEFIDDLHELGTTAAIEADKKRRGRA